MIKLGHIVNGVWSFFTWQGDPVTGAANVKLVGGAEITVDTALLATAQNQDEQSAILTDIKNGVENVGVHRSTSTTHYVAVQNFTGASTGDAIERFRIFDTVSGAVITTVWTNEDTNSIISAPTVGVDVVYVGADALTDVELRATPVTVTANAGTNLSTEAIGQLSDVKATSMGSNSVIAILKGILNVFLPCSRVYTTSYDNKLVVKASAGTLLGLTGYNSAITAQFVQVHDATALPANGAAPVEVLSVDALSNFAIEGNGIVGDDYTNGIVVCVSTTATTLTLATANTWIHARFK